MRIVILGAGISGVGAAKLAKHLDFDVFVSDKGPISIEYKDQLEKLNITYEENTHTESQILNADLVVKSPGIPNHIPLLKKIKAKDISIVSEIEFAYPHTKAKIIAITGSNGKTTSTSLLYHIMKAAKLDVQVGGNIGNSFAELCVSNSAKYVVLELSSFQLDHIHYFKPYVSIVLNITPDHLERYDYEMTNYINAKLNIIRNQEKEDTFIFNQDDKNISSGMKMLELKPTLLPVSVNDEYESFNFETASLKGKHNLFNMKCVIKAAELLGIEKHIIQKGLETFKPRPHRLQFIESINGVDFINDSKATNVEATYFALEAMKKPVVWIVGGVDKGNKYKELETLVINKVKACVFLGIDNQKLIQSFGKHKKYVETKSMDEAITKAKEFARSGDVVLLSPACASFDLFKNYEDRGNQFIDYVKK